VHIFHCVTAAGSGELFSGRESRRDEIPTALGALGLCPNRIHHESVGGLVGAFDHLRNALFQSRGQFERSGHLETNPMR
jgi:hypothetical protein